MSDIHELIQNNRTWATTMVENDPDFFKRLTDIQRPDYLWIGCSDSRVPANEIVGLPPGGLFVHRNVANVVVHSDLNCLSVIQYAIEVLHVRHIIVCGHYGCGGVRAARVASRNGLVDNWLGHVRDVRREHRELLAEMPVDQVAEDALCELNVIEQAVNVCRTTMAKDTWVKGHPLCVHGWIYRLHDGIIRDLGMNVDNYDHVDDIRATALEKVKKRAGLS